MCPLELLSKCRLIKLFASFLTVREIFQKIQARCGVAGWKAKEESSGPKEQDMSQYSDTCHKCLVTQTPAVVVLQHGCLDTRVCMYVIDVLDGRLLETALPLS